MERFKKNKEKRQENMIKLSMLFFGTLMFCSFAMMIVKF